MTKFNLAAAMAELDDLTQQLANDQIPLEDSLELFKKGEKLVKQCKQYLTRYQGKLEQILAEPELGIAAASEQSDE